MPRKHHFIPVFYLEKWKNGDGELVEFSRPYSGRLIAKPVGPKATGFKRDLYSFPNCSAELAQHLEAAFLQRADSLASLAHAKLLAGVTAPWTAELRSAWSRFTLNFLIRHPHPFAEIKAVTHTNWLHTDNVTQLEYERLRQPEDPLHFEQWVLQQGNNLADRIRIRFLQQAMDNNGIGTPMNNMRWNVLDLRDARHRILTSDWPLYREIHGERMLFALPISPTALFTAVTHDDIFERLRRERPTTLVKQINLAVVSSARLYVYGADRSQELFVSNRMSSTMVEPPFFPTLARAHNNN